MQAEFRLEPALSREQPTLAGVIGVVGVYVPTLSRAAVRISAISRCADSSIQTTQIYFARAEDLGAVERQQAMPSTLEVTAEERSRAGE